MSASSCACFRGGPRLREGFRKIRPRVPASLLEDKYGFPPGERRESTGNEGGSAGNETRKEGRGTGNETGNQGMNKGSTKQVNKRH